MSKQKELTANALEQVQSQDNPGGTKAQIAILTERITNLQEHLANNKKDKHSRRGLLQLVANRRKLIKYMRRTNQEGWKELAQTLGLKA